MSEDNNNKKSLYNDEHAHTDEARLLAFEGVEATKNLIADYIKKGYSPHEVEQVLLNGIHLHVCRLIINLRANRKDFLSQM